jgi:hypothetical protein
MPKWDKLSLRFLLDSCVDIAKILTFVVYLTAMSHLLILGHTADVNNTILKTAGYFVFSTIGLMLLVLAIFSFAGRKTNSKKTNSFFIPAYLNSQLYSYTHRQ